MADGDYYVTLGLTRKASAEEIRKAHRKLARETHPDRHPNDKSAEARFKKIQQAYDVLGDAEKKAKYDRFGSAAFDGNGGGGPGPAPGGFHFDMGDMSGLEDMIGGMFGGGRKRRGRAAPAGEDWSVEVSVPFRTAALGGEYDVNLVEPVRQTLTIAIPAGAKDGDKLRIAGKGGPAPRGGTPGNLLVVVRVEPDPLFTREGADLYLEVPITASEALLGAAVNVPTLEGFAAISIPPGTSSGQKLRLRGKGVLTRGADRGDLYVRAKIVVPKQPDAGLRAVAEQLRALEGPNPRRALDWP